MPELQIDAAVATRFISSLSKSLQALCHGCMDFDSGLEIGGHIYIKIDCESKVDYVLDEKVEKSDDNCMKFVSNSFLAKKEKVKHTQDGSCSPVQELYYQSTPSNEYNNSASRYQYSTNDQHPKYSQPHPAQPHVFKNSPQTSARKRKSDLNRSQFSFTQEKRQYQQVQGGHRLSSTSDQNQRQFCGEPLPLSDTYNENNSNSNNDHSDINIKQEACENEARPGEKGDQPSSERLDISSIKTDLDGQCIDNQQRQSETAQSKEDQCDLYGSENVKTEHSLLPCKPSGKSTAAEFTQSHDFESNQESVQLEAGSAHLDSSHGGESSGLGGEFDVIEIDEDDEEMDAMFGGNEAVTSGDQAFGFASGAILMVDNAGTMNNEPCHICGMEISNRKLMTQHINTYHKAYLEKTPLNSPYQCQICTKGFFSSSGLKHHMESHSSGFTCQFCQKSFRYSRNLKRHIEKDHLMKECASCKLLIPIHDLDKHTCS